MLKLIQTFITTPNTAFTTSFVKKLLITQNIDNTLNSTELNKFGKARFKYSKFQSVIDESHESITSNITTVEMRRDMVLLDESVR